METQTNLHQFLKESTRPMHSAAESHPFQGALANGKLTRQAYIEYLQQLQALHSAFESQLLEAAKSSPQVAHVVRDEHYQTRFLENDLAAFHAQPAIACAPVAAFVQDQNFQKQPVSLLGVLYVLLGSKHGGKFIAHSVKQAYELDGAGYTYFNPYGDTFRELWQDFTGSLNTLDLPPEQRQSVLDGAGKTFMLFGALGEEIWARMQAAAK